MPPTLKTLRGQITLGSSAGSSVQTIYVGFLKFHKSIPHQKIIDLLVFFSLNYLPLWLYAPFKGSE